MALKTSPHPSSSRSKEDSLGLEGLIFFCDAVFAIAITLLALDVRLPTSADTLSDGKLRAGLQAIWPQYLACAISFLTIGSFWLGHHRKFRAMQRYNRGLLLLNLLLLMAAAFIPFSTCILSEAGNRTAAIFYALSISAVGLLSTGLWAYAAYTTHLVDPAVSPFLLRGELLTSLVLPGIFIISAGMTFVDQDLAKYFWLFLAPAVFLIR